MEGVFASLASLRMDANENPAPRAAAPPTLTVPVATDDRRRARCRLCGADWVYERQKGQMGYCGICGAACDHDVYDGHPVTYAPGLVRWNNRRAEEELADPLSHAADSEAASADGRRGRRTAVVEAVVVLGRLCEEMVGGEARQIFLHATESIVQSLNTGGPLPDGEITCVVVALFLSFEAVMRCSLSSMEGAPAPAPRASFPCAVPGCGLVWARWIDARHCRHRSQPQMLPRQ